MDSSVLLAIARCETRLEDQGRMLEKMMVVQNKILHELQQHQPVSLESHFEEVDDLLPLDTTEAFDALDRKISLDQEFRKLLVREYYCVSSIGHIEHNFQ